MSQVPGLEGYQLLGEIARGGMGVVYRAQDPSGRVVAVKVLLDHDPDSIERFQREAQLAHRLEHPNVVRVWGHGVSRGRPHLVMDYVDGEDLMDRLKRDGPLPETEARRLFLLLGEALSAAHALGIVHRDLKPQNVLLRGAEVYLTDFGLARRGPSTLTATGELLGTPAYMAPEQAIGERGATGPASDVYGFGATLYTALCGEPPHRAPNLYGTLDLVLNAEPPPLRDRRAQDLSPELEELVVACLRKEASERPSLSDVLRGLARESDAVGAGRGRLGVMALGCALSLGALGLAWALSQEVGGPVPTPSAAGPSLALASASSPAASSPAASSPAASSPAASSPAWSAEREAAERLARTALDALTRYEYDLAQESFEAAFARDPDCAAAHAAKARWAFATNRFGLAIVSAESVGLEAHPELRAAAHYARGRALTRQLQDLPPAKPKEEAAYLARCQAAFQASLDAEPSSQAWAWLGRVQVMVGDKEAARQSLVEGRKVSRVDPHLAVLSHDLDPGPEGINAFIAEGQKQSVTTQLSFELGLLLLSYSVVRGQGIEVVGMARDVLARVRRTRPEEGSAIEEVLAKAYLQRARRGARGQGRKQVLEKARAHFKSALEGAPPGSLRQHIMLSGYGTALLYLGEHKAAAERLEAALAIKPSSKAREALFLVLLALTSESRANWDVVALEVLLKRAREVASQADSRVLWARLCRLEGWALTIKSDFSAAEERFAEALALSKEPGGTAGEALQLTRERSMAYVARGRARLLSRALGRPSQSAVVDFRQAMEADPRFPIAQAWLAHGLLEQEPAEAARVARSVFGVTPARHPARVIAELVLVRKEQRWPALVAYLKIEPGNPRILGLAVLQDPERAAALLEALGPQAMEHPLVTVATSRVGRSKRADPAWYRKVEARLTEELEAHPDFAWVLVERGLIRAKLGKRKLARADLEEAQRVLADPSVQGVLDTWGQPR